MGNDLVFKIAIGVFLGMAAWTSRAELGAVAFYIVCIFIATVAVATIYNVIANPIKKTIKNKAIERLVRELHEQSLIATHLEGALNLGLQKAFTDDDFNSLLHLLDDFKRDLRNGNEGSYYKFQILKITSEIVEDFKLHGVQG